VASLSQGRTAAAQCRLFTYKSVPVIFEPPCTSKPDDDPIGSRYYAPCNNKVQFYYKQIVFLITLIDYSDWIYTFKCSKAKKLKYFKTIYFAPCLSCLFACDKIINEIIPSPLYNVFASSVMTRLLQFMCLRFPTRVLDISVFHFKWLSVDFGYFTFPISYGSLISSFCHYVCFGSCWLLLGLVVWNLLASVCQPLQSVRLTSLWATRLTWLSLPQRQHGGIFILQRLQTNFRFVWPCIINP